MQSNHSAPQSPFLAQQTPISLQRNPSRVLRDAPAVNSRASVPGLEWRGQGLDELRNLRQRAIEYEENGEHEEVRTAFVAVLRGFEDLVGPSHTDTIRTLSYYADFCIAQEDFDEAENQLQQSLAHHQAQHGNNHEKTLRSMARLGNFFRSRNQYGRSEILLMKAKIGLESLYKSDAEELYLKTCDVASDLLHTLLSEGNVEGVEQELLSLITKLEALQRPQLEHSQGPYHAPLSKQRRRLISFYIVEGESGRLYKTPRLKIEQWLLDLIETCRLSVTTAAQYWENYSLLQQYYRQRDDDSKYRSVLATIEDKIKIAGYAAWPFPFLAYDGRECEPFWQLKESLFYSYFMIEDYGRAEWWITNMQNEVEAHVGADSQEAVLNIIHVALRCLRAKVWERAEPLFHEALRRAETVLQPDDPIREKIAKCLVDHEYESVCSICKISCEHPGHQGYIYDP